MKQTITRSQFQDAFKDMGREDNFSYHGLTALYDYFTEYEECTDTDIELDVIALCCEFTEYEDLEEFNSNYLKEYEDIEEIDFDTLVINIPETNGFIIQDF